MPAKPEPQPGSPWIIDAPLPPTTSPPPFTTVAPGYTPKTSLSLIWALRASPLAGLLKTPPSPEDTDEAPRTPYFPEPETPAPPEETYPIPTMPVPPSPATPPPERLLAEPETPNVTPAAAPAKPALPRS